MCNRSRYAERPAQMGHHRNGASAKTMLTEDGPVRIEVPRNRDGWFDPLLIPTHERRFAGFDDKIVATYARGMTMRQIQRFLAAQYGTEVYPEFVSSVTDAVMAEVSAWPARPLEPMNTVMFFDALHEKIREDAVVCNKALDLALGVLPDGTRGIPGLNRTSQDYASWKDRRVLATALRPVYTTSNAEAAADALDAVDRRPWGQKYPTVAGAWRRTWERAIPFFASPPAVRRVVYTTTAVDSIH